MLVFISQLASLTLRYLLSILYWLPCLLQHPDYTTHCNTTTTSLYSDYYCDFTKCANSVEGGNTCYCGSHVSSTVTVLPASQCQTACTGNSSDSCGGTQAMDLYTMAAATDTPATIKASHSAGYLGCFKDAGSNMAFNNYYTYHITSMTVETCKAACVELGYLYAGYVHLFKSVISSDGCTV